MGEQSRDGKKAADKPETVKLWMVKLWICLKADRRAVVVIIGIWSSFPLAADGLAVCGLLCSLYNFYRFESFLRWLNLDQKNFKKNFSHARAYVVVFQGSYVKNVKKICLFSRHPSKP